MHGKLPYVIIQPCYICNSSDHQNGCHQIRLSVALPFQAIDQHLHDSSRLLFQLPNRKGTWRTTKGVNKVAGYSRLLFFRHCVTPPIDRPPWTTPKTQRSSGTWTTMASSKLATVGILSLGDMGSGIAKLLVAKGFSVVTNGSGRSKETLERAQAAGVTNLPTDTDLVKQCDVILSVVPPRDAEITAQRIIDAMQFITKEQLYFADMNAVAPSTIKAMSKSIQRGQVPITLIDGSILGGPPKPKKVDAPATAAPGTSASAGGDWDMPLMPTSGPVQIANIPGYGARLAETLNVKHISPDIGASSGLKMCYASLSKGYAAIAIQSFTTAQRMGVLEPLREALQDTVPGRVKQTENALTGMPPKAYRWVREMEEIAKTHAEEGGFEDYLFKGAAGVFKAVAQDTVLGQEKVGDRKRGRTAEDVAAAMAEGMEKRRKKMD